MKLEPGIPGLPHSSPFALPRGPGSFDVDIEGRTVRLTNLDRVLWPRVGTTKGDMVEYYGRVAAKLLPHLEGRPLTLGRFPMGVDGPGWAQTECRGRPEWMTEAPLRLRTGEIRRYCVVNDLPSLVWVANQGAIELHPFLWRVDAPEQPVEMVLDLDPGEETPPDAVAEVALQVKGELDLLQMTSWAKTTGSAGLHVHAPVAEATFGETKEVARDIARRLAARRPSLVVDRMSLALRRGKVFIDWSQNDPRKSTIAPYSLRAMPEPTAAIPFDWEDLGLGGWNQPGTTIQNEPVR